MKRANGLNAYQQVQAESLAHGGRGAELVVMLYDGVLEALALAVGCMKRKEWLPASRNFTRAMTITAGLRESLDFERGNPVADDLLKFYNSLTAQLIEAQIHRNIEKVEQCVAWVREVRSSWQQLASRNDEGEGRGYSSLPLGASFAVL